MLTPRVVSKEEWITARKQLLELEKEHSRARDRLSRAVRELPWVKVETAYTFDGPDGEETLADLFAGHSQLIVYHFMFDPDWEAGCKSCSFLTDHYQGAVVHLAQRDVALVAISRAPLAKLEAYADRMGWTHKWVSSNRSEFNYDFGVSFRNEDVEAGRARYNYRVSKQLPSELPGLSVFSIEDGVVYHTYSTYARGLDVLIGTYNFLDLVPKGRDEDGPMSWVKRRDEYETAT